VALGADYRLELVKAEFCVGPQYGADDVFRVRRNDEFGRTLRVRVTGARGRLWTVHCRQFRSSRCPRVHRLQRPVRRRRHSCGIWQHLFVMSLIHHIHSVKVSHTSLVWVTLTLDMSILEYRSMTP